MQQQDTKTCYGCRQEKQRSEFRLRRNPTPAGETHFPRCIACEFPEDGPAGFRRCSTCKEIKAAHHFPIGGRYYKGRGGQCKQCKGARAKIHKGETAQKNASIAPVGLDPRMCSRCSVMKAATEFNLNRRDAGGLTSSCKDCIRKFSYHRRNFQKMKAYSVKRKYGITLEEAEAMRETQGNRCALCSRSFGMIAWTIDHCHETGVVRGILCHRCNRNMAAVDEPGFVERALAYIAKSKS